MNVDASARDRTSPQMADPGYDERSWRLWRRPWLKAFWNRAYKENITGLAGMVAYNLMLAVFPFALLVLFVFGQVVNSPSIEHSVILDIQRLFPNIEQDTLQQAIDRVRASSTTIGIAAIVGGIWIGASFWGAMDTAFCRIYHVECRGWLQQKRWSLVMLLGLVVLLLASVTVPTVEAAVLSRADHLPFGLDDFGPIRTLIVVIGVFVVTFFIVCLIYWAVTKSHMPWSSVWTGALGFAATTALGNYIFPLYLNNVSDLHRIGGTIGFILVALVWFYAISLVLLAGAVINSLRHEADDTGSLPLGGCRRRAAWLRHQIAATSGRPAQVATGFRPPLRSTAAWWPLAVASPHDLPQLRAVMGGLHSPHGAGAGAHHQRLGGRVAVVQIADAVEQVAVGDARRGEEDVVAADQVVGVEHPLEVVARVLCGLSLVLVARPEPAEDTAAEALDRGRREHAFGGPANAPQEIDAGVGHHRE